MAIQIKSKIGPKQNQMPRLKSKLYLGLQGHTCVQILNPIRNGEEVLQCIVFRVLSEKRNLVCMRIHTYNNRSPPPGNIIKF